MPGTLHKAYIPLIVVANMLFLPLLSSRRQILGAKEVLGAGLVAAVSYHIRPDLGLCAALVLLAMLVAHALSRASSWPTRIYQLGRLSVLYSAAAIVPTLPLLIVARSQGFAGPLWLLLSRPFKFFGEFLSTVLATSFARVVLYAPIASATPIQPFDSEAPAEAGKTLARIPWSAIWKEGPQQNLAALTYLPLVFLTLVAMVALFLMLCRGLPSRLVVEDDTVGMLALLGLAFSAFPQFFLFRPDAAHLSQFMPGFVVLVAVGLGRWFFPARDPVPKDSTMPASKRSLILLSRAVATIFLILHIGFYAWFGLRRPDCGSIALARGRTERFHGANGVDVVVNPGEKKLFAAAIRITEENTKPNDFVLCLPYCPGFNVMTQRKTFMRRLYVDDSVLILDPGWQPRMIARSEAEQVPLIIIQDWAVNKTEISRFKNWATEVMIYLNADFELVESFGGFHFYVRRDQRMAQDSIVGQGAGPQS